MTMRQTLGGVAGAGIALAMLAGCTPTATPAPTTTMPTTETTVTSPALTPTMASPSPAADSPSASSPEQAIKATIQGYTDFLNRAASDPSVPAWQAGNFVMDVPPDYLGQAVQQNIGRARAEGKTQSGNGTADVRSVTKQSDGTYLANVCLDSSQIVITAKDGKQTKTATPRAAADYTMSNASKDGKWRIQRIKGTGLTC